MFNPTCTPIQTPAQAGSIVVIDLDGVSYRYASGAVALESVSVSISQGERIALLGENGCGKSTLLKMMNGLIAPTAGVVRAFGEPVDITTLRSATFAHSLRRRIGFIFQNPDAQLFSSTVREEIAFGPLHLDMGTDEVRQRVSDVAHMLGIVSLLDRAPFHLSGGEKKKVAIASVLVTNPSVLLLDEPAAGLDPRSQRWLIDVLARLHRAGKTIITATHDLGIVPEIADRAIVMDETHTISIDGPASDILSDWDLLLRVNLIHEHTHRHGSIVHSHPHHHGGEHHHSHEELAAGGLFADQNPEQTPEVLPRSPKAKP